MSRAGTEGARSPRSAQKGTPRFDSSPLRVRKHPRASSLRRAVLSLAFHGSLAHVLRRCRLCRCTPNTSFHFGRGYRCIHPPAVLRGRRELSRGARRDNETRATTRASRGWAEGPKAAEGYRRPIEDCCTAVRLTNRRTACDWVGLGHPTRALAIRRAARYSSTRTARTASTLRDNPVARLARPRTSSVTFPDSIVQKQCRT